MYHPGHPCRRNAKMCPSLLRGAKRRSNPAVAAENTLDCFALLAMTRGLFDWLNPIDDGARDARWRIPRG